MAANASCLSLWMLVIIGRVLGVTKRNRGFCFSYQYAILCM